MEDNIFEVDPFRTMGDNSLGIYELEKEIPKDKDQMPIHSVKELLEWLDKKYPEKCPSLGESERDIFFYAGRRRLIVELIREYERQLKGSR